MPEDEDICSCEFVSHGTRGFGPVDNQERLARVLTHPRHFRKDGGVKPGLFAESHIKAKGLSLMRVDRMDEAELTKQAEAIAMCTAGETVRGVVICGTDKLRQVSREGRRSLCVKDDPVEDHDELPDNPAHAVIIRSHDQDKTEIERIKGELIKMFGGITLIAEVYGRENG